VEYDVKSVSWGTLKDVGRPQKLTVSHYSYLGAQWSLFYNLSNNSPTQSLLESSNSQVNPSADNITWKEDYTILNDVENIQIILAGWSFSR
jgi:hypothetical protein